MVIAASLACALKVSCRDHEAVEETGELIVGVDREYVSDILVGADDHYAALIAIDAPHIEDILAGPAVGAEYLLVVEQPVAPLARQKEGRHGRQVEIAVVLLKDGPEIKGGIDVGSRRGEAPDRRTWRVREKGAESMKAR